jgi:hypothetical protein
MDRCILIVHGVIGKMFLYFIVEVMMSESRSARSSWASGLHLSA